jgi:hypothetical protein
VGANLGHDEPLGFRNAVRNVGGLKRVKGIDGRDRGLAGSGHFRVEARRAIPAAKNAPVQVRFRKGEHCPVLGQRSPPRNHLLQFHARALKGLPAR